VSAASRLRSTFLAAWIALVPAVLYFTTEGTWNIARQRNDGGWSGGFYYAQAEAILHGRLDVPRLAIVSECWDVNGRCYGYFGLTPSLVRIPFLGILRYFHTSFTPLFLGCAVLLAYWAALRLLERSLQQFGQADMSEFLTLGYAVAGAIALGPASSLLFVTRPAVYEEASAWCVAFFLLALGQVWDWHRTGARRALFRAVVFGVLAANARPTAATSCAVLGLVVATLSWLRRSRRVSVAAICLSLLPAMAVGGVFWLKFNTPTPSFELNEQVPEADHWRVILASNGGKSNGLAFTPTEIVAYLRPDAVVRTPGWPAYDFRFPREPYLALPPLTRSGFYVEPVASATSTMPFPWILVAIVVIWLARRGWLLLRQRIAARHLEPPAGDVPDWVFAVGLVASTFAMVVLTVTTVGITNRYLVDFYPISVVAVALGHRAVLPLLRRRNGVAVLVGLIVGLLICWSALVDVSLAWREAFLNW
jgi:hypothetical protein